MASRPTDIEPGNNSQDLHREIFVAAGQIGSVALAVSESGGRCCEACGELAAGCLVDASIYAAGAPILIHSVNCIRVVLMTDLIDRFTAIRPHVKPVRTIDDHAVDGADIFIAVYDAFWNDYRHRISVTNV